MGEEEAVVTTAIKDSKCFFWAIKIGNNTAFLVGSMHLMQEDMHPLPDKFENAFSVWVQSFL